MSRRFRLMLVFLAIALGCILAVLAIYWDHLGLPPFVGALIETPALVLPAAPPQGNWGDPQEGARWEEEMRRIGIELSRRKENGPIRCTLRVRFGTPELEVDLRNASEKPVTIGIHRRLLDTVTFILRDPDGNVVSSFCYITVHSTLDALPPVTLNPGEVDTSRILLSVAADHGYQPLRPGIYSLEAVFHENNFFDPLGPDNGMLARSNRIPIRVE